jgi:flagellar motor switch protein FliM
MSSSIADNLSREKLRQLLSAVGSQPTEDTAEIEATEYNWHECHYFNLQQLSRLEQVAEEMAAAVADKLAGLFHTNFSVTITSVTQHFARELVPQEPAEHASSSNQEDYYLAFGPARQRPSGFIGIPPQTAVAWVTQLLGDSEAEKASANDFSQLEESLLLDVASAIVEALCTRLPDFHNFGPGSTVVKGQLPIELQETEELCKIVFSAQKADSENGCEAYFVTPCSMLARAVGKSTETHGRFSAEDASRAILEHVQEMPVSVTARLACTVLTFEQVMSLRPCDVLILDKPIDEPVELIVDGRTVFRGQPAKSAGQRAVVITESACDTPQGSNLATAT